MGFFNRTVWILLGIGVTALMGFVYGGSADRVVPLLASVCTICFVSLALLCAVRVRRRRQGQTSKKKNIVLSRRSLIRHASIILVGSWAFWMALGSTVTYWLEPAAAPPLVAVTTVESGDAHLPPGNQYRPTLAIGVKNLSSQTIGPLPIHVTFEDSQTGNVVGTGDDVIESLQGGHEAQLYLGSYYAVDLPTSPTGPQYPALLARIQVANSATSSYWFTLDFVTVQQGILEWPWPTESFS